MLRRKEKHITQATHETMRQDYLCCHFKVRRHHRPDGGRKSSDIIGGRERFEEMGMVPREITDITQNVTLKTVTEDLVLAGKYFSTCKHFPKENKLA